MLMCDDATKFIPLIPYKPVDEGFAVLLRRVASGELDKDEAWQIWQNQQAAKAGE